MEKNDFSWAYDDAENDTNVQSASSSSSNEPIISNDQIEYDEQSEFIRLQEENNKIKLALGRKFDNDWELLHNSTITSDSADKTTDQSNLYDQDVFCISFLGDTAVGKSFLVNELISPTDKIRPIVIDERKRKGSTTSNIHCFKYDNSSNAFNQTNVLLLDYEGENGTWLPVTLHPVESSFSSDHGEKRRNAVKEYFPKLAYTISNVIIIVSRDDIFNYEYISKCYEFGKRATNNIEYIPYKPVIIIIQNLYGIPEYQSIKDVTKKFTDAHHPNDKIKLQSFFDSIFCMRLCYNGAGENSRIFNKQLTELKDLLVFIHDKHKRERLISHIPWMETIAVALEIISNDSTIMLHMLLRQILVKDPGDIENNTVMNLFEILYKKTTLHSIHWFRFCRDFATNVLARAIAVRFFKTMKYIPNSNLKQMTIKEEARICLDKLWASIDDFRPCIAIYMGPGYAEGKDRPIFCHQHKAVHQQHRTSEDVYGLPLLRIGKSVVSRFWSIRDNWRGPFQSDNQTLEKPNEKTYQEFFDKTENYLELIQSCQSNLYITLDKLLFEYNFNIDNSMLFYRGACVFCFTTQQSNKQVHADPMNRKPFSPYRNSPICVNCQEQRSVLLRDNNWRIISPPARNNDNCIICMDKMRSIIFDPCHHQQFCQECADRIYELFRQCPLCRANIDRLIKPV